MILLAVQEPSLVMLLLSAISACVGAIIWLALYIRKLHNRMNEQTVKHSIEVKELAVNVAEVAQDMKATVAANTETGKAVVRAVDELHKAILQNLK